MTLQEKLNIPLWLNHHIGKEYKLVNRNKSIETCMITYYPLDYDEPIALVEIKKGGYIDFREVAIRFLTD